jgi:DNA ligase-1
MKPLLAHIYEPQRVTFPCYIQPKLNGIRALYQNGAFQSRDELPFPTGLLSHLAEPLKATFGPEVILDGELYVHGWPLQRINAAVTPVRQQPTEDTWKVEYHVFDVVDFGKSFEERHKLAQPLPGVWPVQTYYAAGEMTANELYAQFVAAGYEGMMYRLGDCPYTVPKQPSNAIQSLGRNLGYPIRSKFLSDQDNRTWHLLKRKSWLDDEFICIDVIEGEGKLKGMLGAVVCTSYETKYHFNIGSGLTDSERQFYWTNSPIGRKVKVKYLCLSSDGIPLNPTILAIL